MSQNAVYDQAISKGTDDFAPVRILQTIRQGKIGGGETHLLSLVESLDRQKYESIVLSFSDGPMIDRLKRLGITTYVIPSNKAFDITVWKEVRKLIYTERIDIVHAHGTRAASNVFNACRFLKVPMIYTIHGWSFHDLQSPLVKQLRIYGERFLTSRAACNISVSRSNQITGKKFFSDFTSIVINNGIDLKRFNPLNAFKNIRPELGIERDAVVILFLARFDKQKQPLTLIKCFSKISTEFKKAHLLMVGDGPEKQEAKLLTESLGLGKRITILPFSQNVPEFLFNSDIYVLPSLWEGMPIGLIEAMAMEKAVLATAVDGSKEMIVHEENGLLITTKELEDNLVVALKELIRNNDLRIKLAKSAKEFVISRYGLETMTKQIETIYMETIVKNGRSLSS